MKTAAHPLSENSDFIERFTSGEHSFDMILPGGSLAASVSATDGLVTFNPGVPGVPTWVIRPQCVIGFESSPEPSTESRQVLLRFRTEAGEEHVALLGRTRDWQSAEFWVKRVNVFYKGSGILYFPGNVELAVQAARSSTPMIDGILEARGFTFIRGRYWNSMARGKLPLRDQLWPAPYNPRWMNEFLKELVTVFALVTGHTKRIVVQKKSPPSDDSLLWTLDMIRPPSRRPEESRLAWGPVLSGELIFAHPNSRQYIEVLPQFEVTHFAVIFPRQSALSEKIADTTMLRTSRSFGNVTLADWFKHLRKLSGKSQHKVPIITLNHEFASFHVANEVARSGEGIVVNLTASTIEGMATMLFEMQSGNAVVVCDIGTAQALRTLYAIRYHVAPEENMMGFARYENPATAGLALPSEDPLFCEIGRRAWRQVIEQRNNLVMKSLKETDKRVEKLGLRLKLSLAA